MTKALRNNIQPKHVQRGHKKQAENSSLLNGEFRAPAYDNRTSCSVQGGDNYGVGFRTPVGKEKASGLESGPIPQKAYSFSPDRIFYGKDAEDKRG